jgi:hypothetical protein
MGRDLSDAEIAMISGGCCSYEPPPPRCEPCPPRCEPLPLPHCGWGERSHGCE